MEQVLNDLIEKYREDIIETTQRLIRCPSVNEEESKKGAPFGEPIAHALDEVLEIGRELGFEAHNYEGYAGTIQWGSEGKQIGILSHVDVVPPGTGWDYPPFEGTVVDGKLYGRGSVDDKGPMVAALYGMKAIRESGLPVKNHLRHIIGADEESGMRCLKYYLKQEDAPWGGFSPDGEFPVIHAEKGILRFKITDEYAKSGKSDGLRLLSVSGGTKVNVVPATAEARLKGDGNAEKALQKKREAFHKKDAISFEKEGDEWIVKAKGQGAHSSQPWNGESAINLLLQFLGTLPLESEGASDFAGKMLRMFGDGYRGEALGVCCEDKLSGILTLSLGVLSITEELGEAIVEIRYPIHASHDVILKTVKVAVKEQKVGMEIIQDKDHLYLPERDSLVQTLLHVYQEVSGRDEEPVVIGGGTYCRAAENFVAYGPVFPGQRELAHEVNEYINIEDLMLSAKIYVQAMYTLLNI